MERNTTINYKGKEREAVEVDFKIIREDWNEYHLDDGTRIRIKPVASLIIRVPNEFDNDGNPVYLLKSSNVMSVSAPPALKKGADKKQEIH